MRASSLVSCAAIVLVAACAVLAAEPSGAECTLVLGNSDQMSGRLGGLAEGRIPARVRLREIPAGKLHGESHPAD